MSFWLYDVNGCSMGEFSRDSKREWLSQKNNFLQKYPFLSKKGFSAFSVMIMGVSGVFPALPEINTKTLANQDVASSEVPVSPVLSHEELCHWQRDFVSFVTLMDGKKVDQNIACTEPISVSPASKESIPIVENDLKRTMSEMTKGYPLEAMIPAIATYDRSVAALIVGIAKKESNWGKRVPRTPDGADCFNYWGWKGAGSRGMAMGHGCFGSPEEAVQAVGNRIAQLVSQRQSSNPESMIIWKCGSSCATHSPESVRKWIADVDLYYQKIAQP